MSGKAEYKQLLSDDDLLSTGSVLGSSLFDPLKPVEYIEDWKPDFESIWRLLHHNYDNPKAVNCFIFYDIADNKVRIKVARYLLERGAQRVQKSVFLANISKAIYQEIFDTMVALEAIFEETDSVIMVPIGDYHLAEMNMIGKDIDMSFSRSSEYVIFV